MLIGIVIFSGTVWFAAGYHQHPAVPVAQKSKGKKPPLVTVKPALKQDIVNIIHLTGVIEPTKVAIMASSAEGPSVECSVREGDRVTKGQTLILVGRKQGAIADVAAAREDLHKQQDEFARIQQLVRSGAVPGDQRNIARADLEKARAVLAAAETQFADYKIVAPWDGVVSKVWVAEGNYVAPRTKLVEMFSPKSLVLRFAVPEANSGQIHKGLSFAVSIDAYPGQKFQSRIVRVYPELDRQTRTLTVEAAIVAVPQLIPGMFVRINLPTKQAHEAVVVPENAVLVNARGENIIFVLKDGKVRSRTVKTGIEQRHLIQILEGLKPGESVVVSGNEHLKNGTSVRLPGSAKDVTGKTRKTGK